MAYMHMAFSCRTVRKVAAAGDVRAADRASHLHPADSSDGSQRGGGGAGVDAGKACTAMVHHLYKEGPRD